MAVSPSQRGFLVGGGVGDVEAFGYMSSSDMSPQPTLNIMPPLPHLSRLLCLLSLRFCVDLRLPSADSTNARICSPTQDVHKV